MNCCPIANCGAEIPSTMLMCREHWRRVPMEIRRAVWDGYEGRAKSDYEAAVTAAIAAVEEKAGA